VPEQFQTGEYVLVQYSPFHFPQILVRAADEPAAPAWLCEPVKLDEFGFAADAPIIGQQYRAQKKTDTARFIDAAEESAKELVAGQTLKVFGHHRLSVEAVQIRHSGVDVLAPEPGPTCMTRVQARAAVIEGIGRTLTAPEAAYVSAIFGEQVTDADVAEAIAAITAGVQGRVLAFPQAKEAAL
jgi:hypothetical protein